MPQVLFVDTAATPLSVERTVDMIKKPTKEQFVEYVRIRDSGITNMYDVRFIVAISETGLDKDICVYIMHYFTELAEEYGVNV